MLDTLHEWHKTVNGWVWGPVTMLLLMGTGLYLTVLTRAVQFRWLGKALREVLGQVFRKTHAEGTVTPFQAVATALASTVGVGNIAGVSTAITIGGPGALLFPDGLANSSGYVGKNLMFNTYAQVNALFEHELNEFKSAQVTRVVHDRYDSDPKRGFYGGGGIDSRIGPMPIAWSLFAPPPGRTWGAGFKSLLEALRAR